MNLEKYLTVANSSGLFELSNQGKVLYSRFRQNNRLLNAGTEMVGQNFFDEVALFENARDLHRIFTNFVRSNQFTDNFVFDCRYAEKTVPVRVMMVRAHENDHFDAKDIIILDIRNCAEQI